MASVIVDTHIVVWFLDDPERLSTNASLALMDAIALSETRIYLSAISLIEIQYLVEKQRIPATFPSTLSNELENPDSIFEIVPIDKRVAENLSSITRDDVPDMPDRIIAATASLMDIPLITADRAIRASGITVIW
ncbi:MAG: type II toxin-antitoxin system VapC family toxin [Pyrinomonadaceae bacterium]